MSDVTLVSTVPVSNKSQHMMTWLLKNQFISSTDFSFTEYSAIKPSLNVSNISLRKRVLQGRLQQLTSRRHSLQNKDLELSFKRENLRRKANELFNDTLELSPMKKPRMGVSSLTPIKNKKCVFKTCTTQTSSSLLMRSMLPEVMSYTRKGVRCTWC